MKRILQIFILLTVLNSNSQGLVQLSVFSEVSVVTAGAGDNLYEAFGHSAIRIKDPVLSLDLIYNYGMFDFDAPNFYTNFTKGKLFYKLGRYEFKYFIDSYRRDKRWLKEQILNLTQEEKQQFFIFLENNARPENANYLYDPFYNNCASKLKDITTLILGDRVSYNTNKIEQNLSLRTLMNRRIHWNSWGNFGINLALGNKLDKEVNPEAYMYLPDYVYEVFKLATKDGKPLVKKEVNLLQFEPKNISGESIGPFLIFLILSISGIYYTFRAFKKNKRNKTVDFITFFITGVIGVLLTFLWFFTDHSTTPNNFNILWAFTPNIIIAFIFTKNQSKQWLKWYVLVLLLLLLLLLIFWIFGVQIFPIAAIPLFVYLTIRYLYLFYFLQVKVTK